MNFLSYFIKYFFRRLYHEQSGLYDLVAWTVSLGAWRKWVYSTLEFIDDGNVLELGCGPGHLQSALFQAGLSPAGVDESMQMLQQAKRRITRAGFSPGLIRSLAQDLPFPNAQFNTVVSTFPTEYILDTRTIMEVWRVLKADGQLVILPWALRTETRWLFEATHQGPSTSWPNLQNALGRNGFGTELRLLQRRNGTVAVILARKPA